MGDVWLAEHSLIGRRAAIKLLHAAYSLDQEIVARFFNEARAAAAIADPGIVQIFDFGYHVDGSAYLVMELLEGEALDKRLERVGTMPIDDALRTIRQVASSLGAAHARGIIHRDLKPENIFLVRDPEVPGGERAKILDFGIAKLGNDPTVRSTLPAAVFGTPMYMSPEQCRGAGGVDARSDVYALGCVLYALITGQPPFDAVGVGELIVKHIAVPAPRASSRAFGLTQSVDDLIARCLAKDRDERFADGTELAHAIGALLAHGIGSGAVLDTAPSVAASSMSAPSGLGPMASGNRPPVVGPSLTTLSASVVAMDAPRRQRHRLWALLVGTGLVTGAITFAVFRSTSPTTPMSAPIPRAPAKSTPTTTPLPPESPTDLATDRIKAAATAFRSWAASHAQAPCPNHGELDALVAGGVLDPWGHELTVTCIDQPADQIIGITSSGPDGVLGDRDDLASWSLGPEITELLRGGRWTPPPTVTAHDHGRAAGVRHPPPKPVATTVSQPPPAGPRGPSFQGTTLGSDGIPTSR